MVKLIALDWGTSSFRAYLLDQSGNIVEKISADAGILSVENVQFAETLRQQLDRFKLRPSHLPIIAAGMITSKQGWVETPYAECPVNTQDLANALSSLDTEEFGKIWFVPGVKQLQPEPDIMRGEETQIAGLDSSAKLTVLLPGTHSKWVRLERGTITGFTTYMTGDLFNAVKNHTILKPLSTGDWSPSAFKEGVLDGYSHIKKGKGLLSVLFKTRVKSILSLSDNAGNENYLSGLLIGTEIGEAISTGYHSRDPIVVLGSETLTKLYITALKECDLTGEPAPADISSRGLYRIACSKQLI
jgi:2-dehydro-3-deoxygalactonokinase